MDVRCVLAKFRVDRIVDLVVTRLKGFCTQVAGMIDPSPTDTEDDNKTSSLVSRVKKHTWVLAVAINMIIAVFIAFAIDHYQNPHRPPVGVGVPASSLPPAADPSLSPLSNYNLKPKVQTSHWLSWAILDMRSGVAAGSENWDESVFLMSTIKPWIAADYLNRHPNPSASVLAKLSTMIINSDDKVAYDYFGGRPSLDRLVKRCGIKDMVYRNWSWSLSEMSARDLVRYGACIFNGSATSVRWTDWIVDKMRHVRGDGDFGPRELFQDRTQIATKNGWFFWEGKWYVNCLAATGDWAIAIIQRWPYSGGDLKYGISLADPNCKSIADQVLKLNTQ